MSARGVGPVLLVAFVSSIAGCADATGGGGATQATRPTAAVTSPSSMESGPPVPQDGVRVAVPTHCGVLSVTVDRRLWLADPPLGDHGPPPGWDENTTTGLLRTTGPRRAEFTGDEGQQATFRLAARGATDPNAGCE